MQTTTSVTSGSSLKQRIGGRLKRVLMMILTAVSVMAGILILADASLKHPGEISAIREWMISTRFGWLAWRLMLYIAVGWGIWKIWHAPGFKPAFRVPLLRMSVVSLLFILLCEYALFRGMEGAL